MTDPETTGDPIGHGWLERVQRCMQIQRYDLAKQELLSTLAQDPNNEFAHVYLGYVCLAEEDCDAAEESAQTALNLNATCAPAIVLLARIRMEQGRHRESELMWIDAIRLDPMDGDLYEGYANLLLKVGRLDKAERLVRKALVLDPESGDAHRMLALILSEAGSSNKAKRSGRKGLQLDPSEDGSHVAMGVTYLRSGHPFRARAHLREAMRIDPDPEVEELFLDADRYCRWIGLPFYHWSMLLQKIPGNALTVWFVVIFGMQLWRNLDDGTAPAETGTVGLDAGDTNPTEWNSAAGQNSTAQGSDALHPSSVVLLTYIAFVIYTWVAEPLMKLWTRIVPPRL